MDNLYSKLQCFCQNLPIISEEEIKATLSLTKQKTIYSYWFNMYDWNEFTLHTGLGASDKTIRYFLCHGQSDWYGGWSYVQEKTWYEITQLEYDELYTQQEIHEDFHER